MTTPDPFAAPTPGAQAPVQPPYDQGSAGQGPAGYGPPPGHGGWQQAPTTETKAMVALGLAIAAYTPTIPFVGAIAAIVVARMARRDILASGGALKGLDLCTWATVLSWVHLALIGLLFLVIALLFVLPFSLAL